MGYSIGQKAKLEGMTFVMTGGRSGEIRRLSEDGPSLERLASWLMEQPEVSHVFSRGRNAVEGVIAGTLAFEAVDLHHSRQPDLAFVLKATNDIDVHGLSGLGLMTPGDVPLGGGMHGGLHPGELNTVLIVAVGASDDGAGVVSDRPAGIIDIAPTVLDLLGLPALETMRGTSLARPAGDAARRHVFVAEKGGFAQSVSVVEQDGRRFILNG
jgi:phosphonoacetate hydrolase